MNCDDILLCVFKHQIDIAFFNHKCGCQKCLIVGVWSRIAHRTYFAEFNKPKRTDFSFRNRLQADHHKGKSVLEDLMNVNGQPLLDMIKQFPTSDPLHLLDEGVFKKCVQMWKNGTSENKRKKWSLEDMASLNRNFLEWNREMPSDIHRKIRSFEYLSHFKATEFRTLLLYVGMVALKNILSRSEYIHFLYLCMAIRILSCKTYVANAKFKENAQKYLQDYCEIFVKLYGACEVVSNIHYISHIIEDVDHFGSLTEISTYPFENFLREIKMNVQPGETCLEQVSRRLNEISLGTEKFQYNLESKKYERAVWVPELRYEIRESNKSAFKFIRLTPNVFLSNRKIGDRWLLTKSGDVVAMRYATRRDDSYSIHGVRVRQKSDFFTLPYSSHITDIYLSDGQLDDNEHTYSHNEIKAKLICLSYEDKFVFIPLLHSVDELNGMWN